MKPAAPVHPGNSRRIVFAAALSRLPFEESAPFSEGLGKRHFKVLVIAAACVGALAPCAAEETAPAVVYLADLQHEFLASRQGWGELGIDTAAHEPKKPGAPLKIGEKTYAKGLGGHANGEIVVALAGAYETFETEVGAQAQGGSAGSVVFKVFVDDEKKFESPVMRGGAAAAPVSVSVAGAWELRLVAEDGGDGITNDLADWAEARLTRGRGLPAPTAGATEGRGQKPPPTQPLDIAPFARVVTCDPARTDGARATRIQEFRAEDVALETELGKDKDGLYAIRPSGSGDPSYAGCIGLVWLERRRLGDLELQFASTGGAGLLTRPDVPSPSSVSVQAWVGASAWQGNWNPLPGAFETKDDRLIFHPDWAKLPEARGGARKVRWIVSPCARAIAVKKLTAYSRGRVGTANIGLTRLSAIGSPTSPMNVEIEAYNCEMPTPTAPTLRRDWNSAEPLELTLRFIKSSPWSAERAVLRLRLQSSPGAFTVAVDDVLVHGVFNVDVPGGGVLVSREPGGVLRQDYVSHPPHPASSPFEKTILARVREMPEQTLAQAMAKTHHAFQEEGPVLLSLACDNNKFVVDRDGRITGTEDHIEVIAQFGAGGMKSRFIEDWFPIVINTELVDALDYRQRTAVAPLGDPTTAAQPSPPPAGSRAVCVVEYTTENTTDRNLPVQYRLTLNANWDKHAPATLQGAAPKILAVLDGRVQAVVDASAAAPLAVKVEGNAVVISGTLAPKAKAVCFVYLPTWPVKAGEENPLKGGTGLFKAVESYWTRVLAPAMQVDIPDSFLANVIKANQVHCLIPARNEENGARVAAWIASMHYGPLESESHAVIRGMDFLGHHDFARRALDFFVHRYNKEGFLTTGYTLMGTGWHLWTLGEHYALTRDQAWMRRIAPEVARVCAWVVAQREKTKRLGPDGQKVPEYGLMPPGVQADWNAFSWYFCLNGYYYAGLKAAAEALKDIGDPAADALLANAAEFREEILRAYRWTQARTPVVPLRDGRWVRPYPSQVFVPAPTALFFPGEDANRSWCYDVELGAHQIVPQGVLDPNAPEVAEMMEHMEDVQFMQDGWFDYPAAESEKDWFNLGGFSKVQPYYCRNVEIYAMRDDVKPFIRSYFNTLAAMLNTEVLSLWEHFRHSGAWNKTHETGYFLQQTKFLFVTERGNELWLAPFVPRAWMKDGQKVAVRQAPTRWGPVAYAIASKVAAGAIEATIEPPGRRGLQTPMPEASAPDAGDLGQKAAPTLVLRLRHAEGKPMRSVTVNGAAHADFDAAREVVRLQPGAGPWTVRAEY